LHSLLEAERDDGSASQDSDARTPIEFSLVAIWKEVLVQKQVTVDDDFFWLGGSSLDAMTMSDRAAELGLRFSIQDVFRHPTIRELAGWLEREPRQTIDAAKQTTPSSLTPRQTTLWYLQKSQPQSCAYHFQLRCSVNVQLDPRRVSRALTELSRRHPTLRSTIRDENGVPKLFVHPDSIVSLRETSSLDNPDNLEEDILEEGRRPFDLTREPAWRVRWINSDATGELVWTFHHIGFDEASIATLLREFGQLYRGESLSDVIALPKPAKESGDVSKTWWESKLVDVSVSVDLPVDRRGRKVSEAGSTHRFSISADVAADLRRVASNARVSLSNLLLAAYGVLLRKYSGATSFTIGVPVSRRGNTQSIGYEIDGLPFVFDRDGTGSFRELAESVHHDFTTMLEHSEVSVESLQREHGSLFNVMFVAQQPFPVITLGEDLRLAPEISDLGAAKFDWTLFVRDGDGAIDCSLEYRTDLFDKSTVERFGRHWESLLRAVADSPDTRVSELEFRGTEDREAAKRLRGDLVSLPQGRNCVSEELKNIASKNPNDIAVFHGSDSWTYAALDEAASGVASALAEVAVGDGTPVAVACDRSTEMVAAIFGVLKAGGAYVPIDPLLPAQRFESLMNQVGASIILSCAANTERMSRSTHQVLEVAKQTRVGSEPAVGQSRESLAYVLHTSGSTGAPKGVEVTRGALIDSTAARSVFYEANPERFLMVSPVWFDSSVAGLFWTLSTGGSLVIPEEGDLGDVARLADLIERRQVTDTL
ncbi:MAG: condensation domain-containing protein, partial [Planctomycetota bacterium]